MICHDVEQGTTPWLELRAGIPTSSEFSRILTPSGKLSTAAKGYMFELLAERLMGHPVTTFINIWMERGHELEPDAVDFYVFQTDQTTQKIGFITNDAGTVGTSPDRLVGEEGLLEVKVPKESTHISYLLEDGPDRKYLPQLQGQLWITGRQWVDICSFHPLMPPCVVRVERNEDYIKSLSTHVTAFTEELDSRYRTLIEKVGEPVREPRQTNPIAELREAMIAVNQGE